MFVHKYTKKGHQYAEVCEAFRDVTTRSPRRRTVKTLGRVIDWDKQFFMNRALGVYHYDLTSDASEPVHSDEIPEIKDLRRREEQLILRFGDVFVIDHVLNRFGLHECINAAGCRRPEALYALLCYYVLERDSNSRAQMWYEGSYARLLYPGASLSSQVVSTLLEELGDERLQQRFFKEYVKYCLRLDPPATNVMIDSTGLPNSIHFPLTAVSNHNGKISREVRLIYVVDQNSGLPVYFRYVAGNIVDLSTLTTTIAELRHSGLKIKYLLLDAGYYTDEAFRLLLEQDITFLTRASSKLKLYQEIMKEHAPTLMAAENLTSYNGRYVYIKKVKSTLLEHHVFAYVCRDMEAFFDEGSKVTTHAQERGLRLNEIHASLESSGYFMMLSTADIHPADLLTTYYTRQSIEQIFDLAKNYANLGPARVHDEQHLRGHLLLTFIGTAIMRLLQRKALEASANLLDLLASLGYQNCKLFEDGTVVVKEAQKWGNVCYKMLNLKCPVSLEPSEQRSGNLPHGT